MDSFQLVIRNYHEEREKTLLDGEEVIIGWLPFQGGEGVRGLFEEAGDCVRRHVVIQLEFFRELGKFGIYLQTREEFFLARGAGWVL